MSLMVRKILSRLEMDEDAQCATDMSDDMQV